MLPSHEYGRLYSIILFLKITQPLLNKNLSKENYFKNKDYKIHIGTYIMRAG